MKCPRCKNEILEWDEKGDLVCIICGYIIKT